MITARRLTLPALLAITSIAAAQDEPGARRLETIEVVGATPLGSAVDADKIASNIQAAAEEQLREQHALDLAEFMQRSLGSVFVNDAQSNPLQPDIQYRGFVGSPLLGLPQGIAVYQDAVRVNEPFGDTVNWALIPDSAIDTVYLMPGSNPLFGLNALGGAISIETKDGFAHSGTRAEAFAGSFDRVGLQAETGGSIDDRFGYFVTGSYLEEDGWRDHSPTEAGKLFASLGWQLPRTRIDASLTYADTDLIGNGAAPVQLLELDRSAIFTRPDQTRNELTQLNVAVEHEISSELVITGNAYVRDSDIGTYNGDDSDFEACEASPGLLCESEGDDEELVLDAAGDPVTAAEEVEGATVNRTSTEQDGSGFSAQVNWRGTLAGRDNQFLAGLAHDASDIAFAASTELGMLDGTRLAVPSGVFVGESFTRMDASMENTGLYLSNVFTLSERAALTLSGRYNRTRVTLRDRLGTALDGDHEFTRFNPSAGLTFAVSDDLTAYVSYSESSRAPSPVELTCADEDDPCRLPNAFLADPPLEQVVARTLEAGVRGRLEAGRWHAGVFRTGNEDDILFISAGSFTNEGFFDNVGDTRRDGVELDVSGGHERLSWFANFTYLDATFRQPLAVPSPNNPAAVAGEVRVERGDRLPLIPSRIFKAGWDLALTPRLTVGGDALVTSGRYARGDEGNDTQKISGYGVLNLRGELALGDHASVFLTINNVLDKAYSSFGLFGEPDEVLDEAFDDSRFLGPGAPRAAWLGVSLSF